MDETAGGKKPSSRVSPWRVAAKTVKRVGRLRVSMHAVLVLGGDPPEEAQIDRLGTADLLVATDGGAAALLRRGIFPHRIVGDMDSLKGVDVDLALAHDVPLERHPRDKMETDGELALAYVLRQRPRSLLLLGGHGGRSAMFLSHLRLLRLAAEAGVPAVLEGHGEHLRVLLPGEALAVSPPAILDLLAMEPAVVTLDGFAYDGADVALAPWTGQGICNPVRRPGAELRVLRGVVLSVIEDPADAVQEAP